nr:MAK10-like protein [Tanacetum cinerariifolium]
MSPSSNSNVLVVNVNYGEIFLKNPLTYSLGVVKNICHIDIQRMEFNGLIEFVEKITRKSHDAASKSRLGQEIDLKEKRWQSVGILNLVNRTIKKDDDSRKEEPEARRLEVEYFDICPTRSKLAYHKYIMCGPIPSIFLRNPIITEGCPSNLKIPCNIRQVYVEKAYIDLNSPLNIMTQMMYNWIMRRKLDPRENLDRGVSNFTRRIKGIYVFIGKFTYITDFMIVEDISSIIDPRLSQVVLGKHFIEISNMTHDPPKGVVRKQSDSRNDKLEENKEEEKSSQEDINTNPSTPHDPSVSFITEKVLKLNSFFESLRLAPELSDTEFVGPKGDEGDMMFIEIVKKDDDSRKEEPEARRLE